MFIGTESEMVTRKTITQRFSDFYNMAESGGVPRDHLLLIQELSNASHTATLKSNEDDSKRGLSVEINLRGEQVIDAVNSLGKDQVGFIIGHAMRHTGLNEYEITEMEEGLDITATL